MEYYKQVEVVFYSEDFPFHISRQGENGERIFSAFHWHEYIEILFCEAGTVSVTAGNQDYVMRPGDMLLIGPDVVHKTWKRERAEGSMYNVLFSAELVRETAFCPAESRHINAFLQYMSSFTCHYIKKTGVPAEMEVLLSRMHEAFYAEGDFNCISLRAYLLEIVAAFCRSGLCTAEICDVSGRTLLEVGATARYVQEHCGEKITLLDMAGMANLSYHYYSRLFKLVTGKTFSSYFASARVFMAEKLMLEGKLSLKEIADQVGLYPQSRFNHTYKRLRGYSPNEFLKKVR